MFDLCAHDFFELEKEPERRLTEQAAPCKPEAVS
jgi:hypothetical protein